MKTFLAVLAAGLIGGGAAIGAVILGLVPVPAQSSEVARTVGPLAGETAAPAPAAGTRDEEIAELKKQIAALEVRLDKPADASSSDELAALRKELDELKKARAVSPRSAATEGEDVVEVTPAPAVTPEFDSAVREVMTRVAEERAEERRLEAQAERLQQLEQQKTQIAEFVPQLVKNQAANLGIAEASIPDVSNALVTHAQLRAELASEMRGLRIDGEEVDDEAYKLKFEELNQNTIAALSSYVDAETAEKLVNSIDRAGRINRDNGNNNGRNGRPGQGRRGN
ncbi:MAG: hypothetical protein H6840_03680 [Planctomycetes bacterium]|nr:hypothetical protein [Planctomycetota bacterium]